MENTPDTVTHSPWSHWPTSIFSVMTQKALAANAINLAQGFPDFDGPDVIVKEAEAALRSGKNQYAPSTGILPLRQAIAGYGKKTLGIDYDPDTEVTVFSGATEAIFCALASLLRPGDEVLTLAPFYDSYPAAAKLVGAELKASALKLPNWEIDFDDLKAQISGKTKVLILNTPHNPTGRVLTPGELQQLATLAIANDLVVITDEVYAELYYEPNRHISMATLPGMRERTITISSTSKTFSMTGWKVGFAYGSEALMKPLRNLHQFTVFCSAQPLQWGMVGAFQHLGQDYYDDLRQLYRKRRDLLCDILIQAGFRLPVPEGSYFICADYSELSDLPDLSFAQKLVEQIGVAAIPISPFYIDQEQAAEQKILRFGFCKTDDVIHAAGDRLFKLKKG